jgi:hypothetical protein
MPRIFKQLGQGYGPSAVSITAQIDGNTVFSGSVPTIDSPVPGVVPGVTLGNECFNWVEPVANFSGSRSFSVSVSGGGSFQLNDTFAQNDVANANSYGWIYTQNIGNTIYSDPLTNVMIDGIALSRADDPSLTGQNGWNIPFGSVFTATLNVNTQMGNTAI